MPKLKFINDVLAVAGNEFRQFRRNRTAILISLVVLPLFFTVSLGAGQGSAGTHFSPTANVPMAFVDNDLTIDSSHLLQSLVSSGDFNQLRLGYVEDNALSQLGTGRIYAVIVVSKGFQDDLSTNQTAQVVLYTDDGEPGISDQVATTLKNDVQNFNPNIEVNSAENTNLASVEIIQKGAIFSGFNVGLVVVLGVVQIFATFYEIAGGMSREREEGTFARLLVSPAGIASIVFGKSLFDAVLGSVRTFIVLGISVYLYGANPRTDFGTLLMVSLLIAFLTMGFGFLVSALRVGTRAVVIVEFFLVLFLFAFSGLIIDKELLRGISQTIATLLPWAYGFEILRRTVLVGRPLLSLSLDLGYMLLATFAFYTLAYGLFVWSRERLAF
jgi:ABC-2 type transport system permease protein